MQGNPLVLLEGFWLADRPQVGGDNDAMESETLGTGCIWLDDSSVISIRSGPPDDPWVVLHAGSAASATQPQTLAGHKAKKARTTAVATAGATTAPSATVARPAADGGGVAGTAATARWV